MSVRALPAAAALVAAGLALTGCEAGQPRWDPVATVELPAPAAEDVATYAGQVSVGPDGEAVVFATGAAGVGFTVVADGAVTGRVTTGAPGIPGAGFAAGGSLAVGHGNGPDAGYSVTLLDPGGAIMAEHPVTPWPAGEVVDVFSAATPDGRLLLAVARTGEVPELLLVDPLTGAVLESATVDVGVRPGDVDDRVDVSAVAVSADGRRVVVAVGSADIATDRGVAVLARLTAELEPDGEPVAVTPEEDWTEVGALAVEDDGTVWPVVSTQDSSSLARAEPGATETTRVVRLEAPVTRLVVRDGVAWLVPFVRGARLDRIDLTGEGTATSGQLCEEAGSAWGAGMVVAGDRVLLAGTCAEGQRLWEFAVS